MGSLLRRAHFESLRAAEAKNSATINQLKYRSRSCITANIALGAWSRAIFAVIIVWKIKYMYMYTLALLALGDLL